MSGEQKEPQQQCALSTHTCRSHGPTPRFPSIESVRTEKMKGEKKCQQEKLDCNLYQYHKHPKVKFGKHRLYILWATSHEQENSQSRHNFEQFCSMEKATRTEDGAVCQLHPACTKAYRLLAFVLTKAEWRLRKQQKNHQHFYAFFLITFFFNNLKFGLKEQ